jgi:hypothetical protein
VNVIFLTHISNSIICIKEHLYNGGCNLETSFFEILPWQQKSLMQPLTWFLLWFWNIVKT